MKLLTLLVISGCLVGVLSDNPNNGIETALLETILQLNRTALRETIKYILNTNTREQTALVNNYVDKALISASEYIIAQHYEPLTLPNFKASFKWSIFSGYATLSNGYLTGLHTLYRNRDAYLTYEYPNIVLSFPFSLKELMFRYNYEAKFMGIGPSGTATGTVKGPQVVIVVNLNLVTLRAKLYKLSINSLGTINLIFSGSILTDWLVNMIADAVIPIFSGKLATVIEEAGVNIVNEVVSSYNKVVCTILGDCFKLSEAYNHYTLHDESFFKNIHYILESKQ